MNCPYKSRPLCLKKIHLKKLRKTMKMTSLKNVKLKTFLRKLQIYIKWTTKIQDTDGFHKIHVPLLGFSTLTCNVASAGWEPHSNKITQGTEAACFPLQEIQQAVKSSLLGRCTDIRLTQGNNPEYILYTNIQQIRDPWDLQEQSTFQCILITTQWSRSKKWTQNLKTFDPSEIRRHVWYCV